MALAIVADLMGQFMPFNGFLKFNLSLIFILANFVISGFWWGLLILFLLFALGPSYSSLGYEPAGLLGHGMLLISQASFIFVFLLSRQIIQKYTKNESLSIKKQILKLLISLTIASIIASAFLIIINLFISTPAFFYLLKFAPDAKFTTIATMYHDNFRPLFFFIPNYYLGAGVVFGVFNLLNYSINSIILFLVLAFSLKTKLFEQAKTNNSTL
nr:hypothetical protein [Mycoplasma simbae]